MPSPAHSSPAADPAAHWAQHGVEYSEILLELAKTGLDLVRTASHRADAVAQSEPPVTAARAAVAACAAFNATSHAVRQTAMCAQRIAEPFPRHEVDPAVARAAARRTIIRTVEDNIHRTPSLKPDLRERLRAELLERLQHPDFDVELDLRTPADIAEECVRDLGLNDRDGFSPWKRRTPADIADLHARAAPPPPDPEPDQTGYMQDRPCPETEGDRPSASSAPLSVCPEGRSGESAGVRFRAPKRSGLLWP